MGRVKWDASVQTGLLSPNDDKLKDNVSDIVDTDFGGHREHSNVTSSDDYTSRTKGTDNKENPVDATVKDIDGMTDTKQRKREFSRREETSNTQESNEAAFMVKSDSDNLPSEDTDAFIPNDPNIAKRYGSKNKYRFDDGQYEGEIR